MSEDAAPLPSDEPLDCETWVSGAARPRASSTRLLAVASAALMIGGVLGIAGTRLAVRAATNGAAIDTTRLVPLVDTSVVDVVATNDSFVGGGAEGTGMLVGAGGLVLTNNHVVENAVALAVAVPRHGTHRARLVAADPSADLALLQVAGVGGLPTVRFATALPGIGAGVLAFGNALGLGGAPAVTEGFVTATGRSVTATGSGVAALEHLSGLLETNASIVPGNSGGPLIDAAGRVVGMDTAAVTSASAPVGFAIPSRTLTRFLALVRSGRRAAGVVRGEHGFLGVETIDVPRADPLKGADVVLVERHGPAAQAGIVRGDLIVALDHAPVRGAGDLAAALRRYAPGSHVTVSWDGPRRSGISRVVLGVAPLP